MNNNNRRQSHQQVFAQTSRNYTPMRLYMKMFFGVITFLLFGLVVVTYAGLNLAPMEEQANLLPQTTLLVTRLITDDKAVLVTGNLTENFLNFCFRYCSHLQAMRIKSNYLLLILSSLIKHFTRRWCWVYRESYLRRNVGGGIHDCGCR